MELGTTAAIIVFFFFIVLGAICMDATWNKDSKKNLEEKTKTIDEQPCNGFDEDGFPMKNSPWSIHHSKCDNCQQQCPLDDKSNKV